MTNGFQSAAQFGLDDIRAAAERIRGFVRATPILDARSSTIPRLAELDLVLKLECHQVTGSFKARGAISKLKTLDAATLERGLTTASGGNHGIAVAYAGHIARRPVTVFAPTGVAPLKAQKIVAWGAKLQRQGAVFDEANRAALDLAARDRLAYIHPFADPAVVAGQGTVGLETLEQIPDIDTMIIAIGGGGLIAGVGVAIKSIRPHARIIGVEPVGAPTLKASFDAGEVVELETIDTIVPTMAAKRTEPFTFAVARRVVDDIVLVGDDDMREAARALWLEFGVAADLSGAASVAALMTGAYRPAAGERVCALICGAGPDGAS